ncbi:hypothetical protein AAFP35_03950 [Gordonia sp. CPCC 206044]|uniref:TY-Chap domain-containing protein n=1 Tax=Gordonia sp. CPCC 206044 TaxID=3140793 RepID=UPI003AF3734E
MSDFDRDLDEAWTTFTIDLTMRLRQLERGDSFDITQLRDVESGPHAALRFTRAGRWRCTVDSRDLSTMAALRDDQFDALRDGGWRELRNGTLIFEVGSRRLGALAAAGTHALRQVWEIIHPAFLAGSVADPIVEAPLDISPGQSGLDDEHIPDSGTLPRALPTQPADDACLDDGVPDFLVKLIELDKEAPLTPIQVAYVCRYDVPMIVGHLEICRRELREWRENLRSAHSHLAAREDIRRCEDEAQGWRRFVGLFEQAQQIATAAN